MDREKIARGMTLPSDPRLAAVADALPYIEQLERQVERLSNQVTDYREKVGNLPELQHQMTRLRNSNERLVAENTALRGQLNNREPVTVKDRSPKDPALAG